MIANRIHKTRPHLLVRDEAVQLGGRCAGSAFLVAHGQRTECSGHFDFTSDFLTLDRSRASLLNVLKGAVCSEVLRQLVGQFLRKKKSRVKRLAQNVSPGRHVSVDSEWEVHGCAHFLFLI